MTAAPIERPGRWALPPQLPETWVGASAGLILVIGVAVSLAVPSLALLPADKPESLIPPAVHTVGSLLFLSTPYPLGVPSPAPHAPRLR